MAQRYGGKFSPEGKPVKGAYRGAKRTRVGGRVNLLFIIPLPLIWKAFTSDPVGMAQYLVALGALILAAWLTREGLLAQEAYEARKVARRPALPRKIVGSILTGLGLGIAGFAGFGVIEAAIFAVLGAALHAMAFGIDPLKDKGMDGVDTFQTDRVARAVDEAEKHLTAMTEAMKRAGDRQMMARLEAFQATARDLFRTVEEDPRDLTAARKYLSVYLMGARDATVKFADIYGRSHDEKAKADYAALLDDLEQNFAARTQKMLLDDRSDLNIEIEVLRDRLKREGIRAG
ncbi:5-bromo-4-chloroindolyl phosphate hydrolysis family protein [Thalassovita aquimarina]|uniref:5-bromo-4-chloroindolyl phosphate hydrolysis family protein n=1 Tax=Thalassovita aquimarina TaxID=2785917 RepID=UPI0035629989